MYYIDVPALRHWRFESRAAAVTCAESWNVSADKVKELPR